MKETPERIGSAQTPNFGRTGFFLTRLARARIFGSACSKIEVIGLKSDSEYYPAIPPPDSTRLRTGAASGSIK